MPRSMTDYSLTSLPVLPYYITYQLFPSFSPSHLAQHRKFPSFTVTPEYIPRNNFIHTPSLQAAHPKTLLMRKFICTMSHTTPYTCCNGTAETSETSLPNQSMHWFQPPSVLYPSLVCHSRHSITEINNFNGFIPTPAGRQRMEGRKSVSYTHLTLPTIA